MRLLDVETYKLHTFYGNKIPRYAILSHTWLQDHEEVKFSHLQSEQNTAWKQLPGAKKVELTCRQAINDGYYWAWIDTCCIDKTNSSELSEAINSMFRWYQKAALCYVYLADVGPQRYQDLFDSRWWTRAWTLQELVAPRNVRFFDLQWHMLGTKLDLAEEISRRMSIDLDTLRESVAMYTRSVAQRMSWAAYREATREEDLAYSLLGIFNINITMQYGEGKRAFLRVQEEISRTTPDMSILAWGLSSRTLEALYSSSRAEPDLSLINKAESPDRLSLDGLYADSPQQFWNSQNVRHITSNIGNLGYETHHGVQSLNTIMIQSPNWSSSLPRHDRWQQWSLALLPCVLPGAPQCLVGILLRRNQVDSARTMRRSFHEETFSCLVRSEHISKAVRGAVEVDTWDNHFLRENVDSDSISRTLLVKQNTPGEIPFHLLQPSQWQADPHSPHRFTTIGKIRRHTILRWHNRNAPLCICVGFKMLDTVDSAPQTMTSEGHACVMRALPASTASEEAARKIHDALENPSSAEAMVSRLCTRSLCGHDRVCVFAETKIVFNQALTTLSLAYWDLSGSPSFRRLATMCIKPKEWRVV